MDEAAQICARLIAFGAVPRKELSELDHPILREEVEKRLEQCGFALASSAYSDHYGVRLVRAADASVLDTTSNMGLAADACALITVLWARLALQKRTATDAQATPSEQGELLVDIRREKVSEFRPSIRFETLAQEFGRKLGGKVRLKALLGHLRKLKFITFRRFDDIQAGPLLELAIDGEKMVGFIRSRVLSQYLETSIEENHLTESSAGDRIIEILTESGQPLSFSEIGSRSGIERRELRRALQELREDQRVESIGAGSKMIYRIRAKGA